MLQLANMHHRMKANAGRKVQSHGYWVDHLSNLVGANPAGSQFACKVARQLKMACLQPHTVTSTKLNVPATLVGISGHVVSCFAKMGRDLGVNLGTRSNQVLHRLHCTILQLVSSKVKWPSHIKTKKTLER